MRILHTLSLNKNSKLKPIVQMLKPIQLENVRISRIARAVIMDEKSNVRTSLAKLLNVLERTINDWLRENEWNSKLTLHASVNLISEITGLSESQILEKKITVSEIEMELNESDVNK